MTRAGFEVHVWREGSRWKGKKVNVKDKSVPSEPLGRMYANVAAVRRAAKAKWPALASHVVTLTKGVAAPKAVAA